MLLHDLLAQQPSVSALAGAAAVEKPAVQDSAQRERHKERQQGEKGARREVQSQRYKEDVAPDIENRSPCRAEGWAVQWLPEPFPESGEHDQT